MTSESEAVFFDTSVMLAALIDFGEASIDPIAVYEAMIAEEISKPVTAWHCCLEFYSVATRLPEEFRLKPADARRLLAEEILERFDVRDLPARKRAELFDRADREGIAGGRIYDSEIAAVAVAARVSILVTENRRHFLGLDGSGVRVLSSRDLRSYLRQS